MDIGFETIGNATVICYDRKPVLITDPWLEGNPYFGSWALSYEIPEEQMEAAKQCEYVWVSHGHPDHLSVRSLRLLKDAKILIPDHVGGRIAGELGGLGFNVTVLKNHQWTELSPRLHVLSIPDYNQDAILLIDLDGTLLVDLNDASPRGWGPFVRKTTRKYGKSFLLEQFGYGTTDMINFFDESGSRIEPRAALRLPVGRTIALVAETFGVTHAIPFSSLQKCQRADSVWVNEYATPLEAYNEGFESDTCELLPAFVRYDKLENEFARIDPAETPDTVVDPKEFGDDWSDTLEQKDVDRLDNYFRSVERLGRVIDFINVRVGDEDNVIELRGSNFRKGIVFEVPRRSLMRAIRFEAFDDLLIGNFMKTTLVGKWPKSLLYPDFTPYVTKYADNGLAKTPAELKLYFREYRHRAPLDYLRHRIQLTAANAVRTHVNSRSKPYQIAQKAWWFANKMISP